LIQRKTLGTVGLEEELHDALANALGYLRPQQGMPSTRRAQMAYLLLKQRCVTFAKIGDRMQCLKDCLELVISNLPRAFKADSRFDIDGSELRGLDRLEQTYGATKYAAAIAGFRKVAFVFDNRSEVMGLSWIGFYQSMPQRIVGIRISALLNSCEDASLETVLAYRNLDVVIQSFRSILLHELRHVFQSFIYPMYYHKIEVSNVDYRKDKTEIDAAWMHHLEDYDPHEFQTGGQYVNEIIDSLASYKSLTAKERKHYFRKTARYYQNVITTSVRGNA
jgi:hypothetical protein